MEILQLDKPDTGYDRSLDSKHVSLQGKEELLAHSSSGNLHERCFHDIFLLCKRVLKPRYCSCVPGRYRTCGRIPWNLHPRNEETDSIM